MKDLEPGTPVTRLVSNANGTYMQTRHGVVVRKLRVRYLIRWSLDWGLETETPHKRIRDTRSFL